MDGIKNRDETDIDCGGIKCPKCEDMQTCKDNCDCISEICKKNVCIPAESCEDNIKNQDETDVDCGGNKCPKCEDEKICHEDCDCLSRECKNNTCAPTCIPRCKNNGICISYNNCSCPTGFSGPTCEVQSVGLCHDNETLGTTPILLITFENGSAQYSTNTPARFNFLTTYTQRFEPVTNDGAFSFINSIPDDFGGAWHTNATDHTEDEGGYMFLVNADYEPGHFYNGRVNHLCVGLRYEFSVYLANVCKPTDRIEPNVRFEVRSPTIGNQLLAQLSSGPIPVTNHLSWNKYGLSFTAPSSSVVLLMISDAPGGKGNDIVIDDIALRVCSHEGTGFCPSYLSTVSPSTVKTAASTATTPVPSTSHSQNFVCPREDIANTGCKGPKDCLYPNPQNCNTFIQCVPQPDGSGNPVVMPCAPSNPPLEWNDNKKECDYPGQGTCPRQSL